MTDVVLHEDVVPKQGVLNTWNVEDGAVVKAGDVLCEVETEKAQIDIAAPVSGTLKQLKCKGSLVDVGDVIASIE